MLRPVIRFNAVVFLIAASLTGGCDRPVQPRTPLVSVAEDQLTQVSIINALMLGEYNGMLPMENLLRYGNFGLGTCDHLDGELIVLDGVAYQARSDGTVRKVSPQDKTPFAVITPFHADGDFACPLAKSLEQLDAQLNKQLPSQNSFVAVRIEAKLKSIHLRSVPRQEPPYARLAAVAKKQTTWTRENVEGTLIGIRCPGWVAGLNVPGFHWHFLSSDHTLGGHVIDCQIESGKVSFDVCDSWLIKLSDSVEFQQADFSRNLSKELESVERSRGK
ncbi:MAG: acetolactate decarboxylase [Planctomycetes bacterium]|nr:acetolactate decarboxylase [Planctomycetota bacterium]